MNFVSIHRFFIFFPEIINRIANSLDDFVHERAEMCDTLNMNGIVNASEVLAANGTINAEVSIFTILLSRSKLK